LCPVVLAKLPFCDAQAAPFGEILCEFHEFAIGINIVECRPIEFVLATKLLDDDVIERGSAAIPQLRRGTKDTSGGDSAPFVRYRVNAGRKLLNYGG
jgi:hypothetical protein